MAEAYHKEASRKQRIIDKQHAALARIAIIQQLEEAKRKETEERRKIQLTEKEKEKGRKREEYLRSMGRTQGVGNTNYTQMLEEQKKRISQGDLRHQEKILRDHCLVMGHVNTSFLA